jgi:hypothetical protein
MSGIIALHIFFGDRSWMACQPRKTPMEVQDTLQRSDHATAHGS